LTTTAARPSGLRFFGSACKAFKKVVQEAWSRPVNSDLLIKRLHIKMARVAKSIKRWRKEKIGGTKLQLDIIKEFILQLEVA
jgi:hypothetical protein